MGIICYVSQWGLLFCSVFLTNKEMLFSVIALPLNVTKFIIASFPVCQLQPVFLNFNSFLLNDYIVLSSVFVFKIPLEFCCWETFL